MKIWILGADGQLGRTLASLCQRDQIPFVASKKNEADVTSLESLQTFVKQQSISHVINCAAYTNVDQAETEPHLAYDVNAKGPENLAILGNEFDFKVIHISTDYVFDGSKRSPYVEEDVCHPLSIYGKSKNEGEKRLFDQYKEALVVRTSWIFGFQGKNFVSSILDQLKTKEKIYADDNQISSPTYNCDLAKVLLDLRDQTGIIHFSQQEALTRYQIACDFFNLAKELGMEMRCQKITALSSSHSQGVRPKYSVLGSSKLKIKPREWKSVLREYIAEQCLNVC